MINYLTRRTKFRSRETLLQIFPRACLFRYSHRVASRRPPSLILRKLPQSGSKPLQERAGRLEEQSFLPNWQANVRDFLARLVPNLLSLSRPDHVQHLPLFLRARERELGSGQIPRKNQVHCDRWLVSTIYPVADCLRGDQGRSNFARDPDEEALEGDLLSPADGSISYLVNLYLSLLAPRVWVPDFRFFNRWMWKIRKKNYEI